MICFIYLIANNSYSINNDLTFYYYYISQQNFRNTTQPHFNQRYYFIAAAVATNIDGIVHLYGPLISSNVKQYIFCNIFRWLYNSSAVLDNSDVKKVGQIWYYIGIEGNSEFILLYCSNWFSGNTVNGRGERH